MAWLKSHVRRRAELKIFSGILITFRYPQATRTPCVQPFFTAFRHAFSPCFLTSFRPLWQVSNRSGLVRLGFQCLSIEKLKAEDVVTAARYRGQEWRVSVALGRKASTSISGFWTWFSRILSHFFPDFPLFLIDRRTSTGIRSMFMGFMLFLALSERISKRFLRDFKVVWS